MKKFILIVSVVLLISLIIGCNPAPKSDLKLPGKSKTKLTYLPKGTEPKEYVADYYENVISGKLEKAYPMLPGENKSKQSKKEYTSMHKQLEIKSYKIIKVSKSKQSQSVSATLELKGYSGWKVVWVFVKHKKGWAAVSSASSQEK